MGSDLILERIAQRRQQPQILIDLSCEKAKKLQPKRSTADLILERVETRRWVSRMQDMLRSQLKEMKYDVWLIAQLPKKRCKFLRFDLKIDVERYCGTHTFWWLSLENAEWIEEQWPDCPKVTSYHIGNYWEQAEWFRLHGNCDVPGENTDTFISDRAKWAHKCIGKYIRVVRQMLQILMHWNFSDEQKRKYARLENKLWQIGIVLS